MIAICSLEVELKQINDFPLNRLLFIVDKMNQSDGIEKIVKQTNKMAEFKNSDSCQLLFKFRQFIPNIDVFSIPEKKEIKVNQENDFFNLLEN